MGVKERIREFVKYKRITERAFCTSIGVSFSYVNSIRKSIQPDKMKAITTVYPELNPIWLITGDGEMLIEGNTNNVGGGRNNISELIDLQKGYQTMIKEKDDQINRLISIIEKISEK
jgi:transcriptional regulator with XRE-family HTH domain